MRSKDPVFIFDKRLVHRHMKEGKLKESDLTSHLNGLSDSASKAETIKSGLESLKSMDDKS
jgi:hypothetical protein